MNSRQQSFCRPKRTLSALFLAYAAAMVFGTYSQSTPAQTFDEIANQQKLDLITSKINNRHRHSEFFLGTSIKQVNFYITQNNNNATGSIRSRSSLSYFIRINSTSYFFNNSNIGAQLTATGSSYSLSEDETDNEGRPFEENMSGYYGYVAPVLFYLYGNRYNTRYFKAGVAPGISIVNYKGRVLLDSGDAVVEAEIETPRGMAFQSSVNLLLESKWDNWSLLLSYSNYALSGSTHHFDIKETAATAAYSWAF